MAPRTRLRALTSGALGLTLLALAAAGCSTDGPVKGLGFVEVSWTIGGEAPSSAVCAAAGAEKVRISYTAQQAVTHDCATSGATRRSAGAGAALNLTVDLLSTSGAVIESRARSVEVASEETDTVKVDFLSAGSDGGGDGAVDAGSDGI